MVVPSRMTRVTQSISFPSTRGRRLTKIPRMSQVLDIVQAGEPVLRQLARRLDAAELATPRIQTLIESMRETMRAAPGVGLAAPQVGESLQLVVIEDPARLQEGLSAQQLAERERKPIDFHVLVNPRLHVESEERAMFFEGCLSVKDFVMIVPRARRVRVEALDEHGTPVVKVASGWYARILQHEIDHLNGTLCIDRMCSRSFMSMEQHGKFHRGKSVADVLAELSLDARLAG
jgi:peptide deformylase